MSTELLSEAEKMARVPGITFADGPAGRRARVAGTGLEVFEVISAYLACNRDWKRLADWYHWLSDTQLQAALRYYALFPEEIDSIIEEMDRAIPDDVRRSWQEYAARKDVP